MSTRISCCSVITGKLVGLPTTYDDSFERKHKAVFAATTLHTQVGDDLFFL